MVDGMKWIIVKHEDLSDSEAVRIAELKKQYWPYSVESQLLWMADNIQKGDSHLMGEENINGETKLIAYITLTKLNVVIDHNLQEYIGVGCVCVDISLQHSGLGKALMETANQYINEREKMGILLCKNKLVGFYQKCNWHLLDYKKAYVAGAKYDHRIMHFHDDFMCDEIIIDRAF